MKLITASEFQRHHEAVMEQVFKGETVIVMRRGKYAAVLCSLAEEDVDDSFLYLSPAIRERIEESRRAQARGEARSAEDLLRELEQESDVSR